MKQIPEDSRVLKGLSIQSYASILIIILLLIGVGTLSYYAGIAKKPEARSSNATTKHPYIEDQVLIKFKENVPDTTKELLLKSISGKISYTIEQLKVHVVKIPQYTVPVAIAAFSHNPNVEFAEPDYLAQVAEIPNDPSYSNQKFLQYLHADKAFDITHGSPTVIIADLDTGVDIQHSELGPNILQSKVFTGEASDGDDNNGHGTKTSGIAAAISGNTKGVASVGYQAKILNGKICDSSGQCTTSGMSNGLTWAADNGAKVINLSLMQLNDATTLHSAVDYAWNKGAIVVVSAGNCGDGTPSYCNGNVNPVTYPASYANAIAVGATTASDTKAWYSEYGSWVDVAAPVGDSGELIYTTTNGGGYGGGNGTSFSAPQVTGLAALLFGEHPTWTNQQVRNQIESTADKVVGTGTYWASGRINACRAVGNPGDCSTITTPTATPTVTTTLLTPTAIPTPTSTPTIYPTNTPTISLSPTLSVSPSVTTTSGDFNNDGKVDLLDFNLWRDEFSGTLNTKRSDQNGDGVIDLLDFNRWLLAFQSA